MKLSTYSSVSNATLNRFFSLHFVLPFLLAALALAHLIVLHVHGSNNPNGVIAQNDRYPMHPYFTFKVRRWGFCVIPLPLPFTFSITQRVPYPFVKKKGRDMGGNLEGRSEGNPVCMDLEQFA